VSGVGDKITIAEARARRSDPEWRRRHKLADITGIVLVILLVTLPPLGSALWRPLGVGLALVLLLAAPAALWWRGPTVGLDRRSALLVAVPVLGLLVLVPALWRAAHLHLQHWQGPLQPPWGDSRWLAVGAVGAVAWLFSLAGLVLSLT